MGPHLIKKLLDRGYDVTVCTRGYHAIPFEESVKGIICDCNNDGAGTKKALNGLEFDIVIDCISYCPKEVFNILSNVKTTRYIQISSIGAYWDAVSNEDRKLHSSISEDRFDPQTYKGWKMDVNNMTGYGDRKKYAECVAYQMFPQCNPVTIRPAYVADPLNPLHEQNVRLPEMVDWIRKGTDIKPNNKNYAVSFTRVDEEADLILKLMTNSYNKPLNISSVGYIKVGDIVAYIANKLEKKCNYSEDGKLPEFPSGINLNVERLSTIGFKPSKLKEWFGEYLDYYIETQVRNYRPWKVVRSDIDTFRI